MTDSREQAVLKSPLRAAFEMLFLFGFVPIFLGLVDAPRLTLMTCLWSFAAFALFYLHRDPAFSWRRLWQGQGWAKPQRDQAVTRFLFIVPALVLFTFYYAPDRLFSFPILMPWRWALVMLLYPVLSVLPQSIVFRVFFFARYEKYFSSTAMLIVVNALCFGMAHSMYGNWIAPVFAGLAGGLLATSYSQHRSLKWALIEHALYGNLVFTIGIGRFFFKHG